MYFSFRATARLDKFSPFFSVSVGIILTVLGFNSHAGDFQGILGWPGRQTFQIQGISFLSLRECRLYLIHVHVVLDFILHDFSQFGPCTRVRVGSRIVVLFCVFKFCRRGRDWILLGRICIGS